MGLFSKNPDKGWGGKGDRCVVTGYKANDVRTTIFGGKVKTNKVINGGGKKK